VNKPIIIFRGQYRFLSNFYPCKIVLDGMEFPAVEYAYQAAKTNDPIARLSIKALATPRQAMAAGNSSIVIHDYRPTWNQEKLMIMYELLKQKFSDKELRRKLLDTKDAYLIAGNSYEDTYYGVCRGKGKNMLGILLMTIRGETKEEK
jgi:ribA/ribD-fused uncharacterized protein